MKAVYEKVALSSATIFKWHNTFMDRMRASEDKQQSWQPSMPRTDKNLTFIKAAMDQANV